MDDARWMNMAIDAALESRRLGDYAIGSVVAQEGRLISVAGNRIRTETDPTSHTEVVAIRMACRDLQSRYLTGCTLYSTHAPCILCLGACLWSKVDRIVYGAYQADIVAYGEANGNETFKWRGQEMEPDEIYEWVGRSAHPTLTFTPGFMREECIKLFHNGSEERAAVCPTCGHALHPA